MKLLLILLGFVLASVVCYFVLKLAGIANIQTIRSLILKSGNWGYVSYFFIILISLVLFCFVPALDSGLIVLGAVLFGAKTAFVICAVARFVACSLLFCVGDRFGERLAAKLIGKDELLKAQNLFDTKSKILLPIILVFPGMPDEGLCLVAGMTKMRYWYFALVVAIFETLEVALVCFFSSGIINWAALSVLDWIIFVNIVIVDIYLILKLERYLENKHK